MFWRLQSSCFGGAFPNRRRGMVVAGEMPGAGLRGRARRELLADAGGRAEPARGGAAAFGVGAAAPSAGARAAEAGNRADVPRACCPAELRGRRGCELRRGASLSGGAVGQKRRMFRRGGYLAERCCHGQVQPGGDGLFAAPQTGRLARNICRGGAGLWRRMLSGGRRCAVRCASAFVERERMQGGSPGAGGCPGGRRGVSRRGLLYRIGVAVGCPAAGGGSRPAAAAPAR